MNPSVIELEDVTRTFPGPREVCALRGITLTIPEGGYASIVGPSGSGKSTLLNTLGLLDRPTSGRYRLTGIETGPLSNTNRSRLRSTTIGFVFQAFHLLPHLSAIENVVLGMLYAGTPRADRLARALDALDAVGLADRKDASPRTLSGGERQRVAIARAVAQRPALLLADEPTGNLDAETTNDVLNVFDQLHDAGLTLVVITHDQSVAARAERTYTIVGGRLQADCSPGDPTQSQLTQDLGVGGGLQ